MKNLEIKDTIADDLATVVKGKPAAQGEQIPAPANEPDYHQRAAGFVGDYRPMKERLDSKNNDS